MDKIKNKSILLIGGTGFIGANLARRLSKLNVNLDVLYKGYAKNIKKLNLGKNIRLVEGDITNYKSVEENVKGKDVIINLAAVKNQDSNFNPFIDLDINCRGQLNVLEARKDVNPNSKYIFLGTRVQFGNVKEKDLPVPEDYCQKPISLYGIHKQTCENYCSLYKRAFNLNSVVLRASIVYGNWLSDENSSMIDKFVKKALKNERFYVNGYGKDMKDLIYIDDLIDLIIKVIESDVDEGAYNVGSGEKIRLIDIAKKIVNLCGSGSFEAVPFPKETERFELGSFYFDISKVKKEFKWKPKTSIDSGLKKMIVEYK